KKLYGDETLFYFITGADAVLEILTWKNADELLRLCYFVAATRPGIEGNKIDQELDKIRNLYGNVIYKVTVPSLAISSTDIRERVAKGRPIKYLLPEPVERYIQKYGLYKEDDSI
ncbi:MAG: nicotinate-nicotinamide nucleotide adenylyltransferase, partial [Caldanaerobacter sp.]